MTKRAVTLLLVCGTATSAFADGRIVGRVIDASDQPLRDVSVVISGSQGVEATVVTDPTGHYAAAVKPGPHTVVFAFGSKRVTSRVDVIDSAVAKLDGTLEIGGEIIDVLDTPRPAKPARPRFDPLAIPAYSDKAALTDTWSKAWVLLEVDERGVVERMKFLQRPGNDLDDIAVKHAFGLKFDPARNKYGYPTKSYVVWPIEWPSLQWLQEKQLPANRLPNFFGAIPADLAIWGYPPCSDGPARFAGTSGSHATRDCSVPDLSHANASELWIQRDASMPDDAPVVAVDPRKEVQIAAATAHRNRITAIATTMTTVALAAGGLYAYSRYGSASDRVDADMQPRTTLLPAGQLDADQRNAHRWGVATFGFALGAMVTGITSSYFWSRATPSVSLTPNGEATLGMSGRF